MTSARSRFLVPTLTTLIMLAILVGLGTWQIYRLQWKQGVLRQIAAAEAAPAVPLTPNPSAYTKVSATGRFRFDLAAHFGAEVRDTNTGPTMGSYQIVPLQRDGAATVLVNRGWVPQQSGTALDQPGGVVSVTGYVRPGETQHWFSPADDVPDRQFFTLDPAAIGAAVGVRDPLLFTLVALGSVHGGSYPAPAQHLPRPPNNHLSYVITWYGLAVALVVIFAAWLKRNRAERNVHGA